MNSTAVAEIADNGNKYTEAVGPFISVLDILDMIVGIVAILINSLAIYILTAKLKLKQSDTILSFILSVFDIVYSIFMIINCLVLLITNHSAILVTLYSQLVGYLSFCLRSCVIDTVTLLSSIRFLAIYKQVQYSNKFWVRLMLALAISNFTLGLIPLVQSQFKVQPSLKYSSVEFSLQNNWSINFYYCVVWIKIIIDMIIIGVCYVFISLYYYNYLKNYKEEVEVSEKLPKVNMRDDDGVQFDIGSTQLELNKDNDFQRKNAKSSAKGVRNHVTDNTATSKRGQSDFHNNYKIDNLIRMDPVFPISNYIRIP